MMPSLVSVTGFQDKVRRLSSFMRHHIATENLYVFPRLAEVA